MKYNQNILNLMRDLSNAPGAPGFEDEVLTVARKALGDTVRIEEVIFAIFTSTIRRTPMTVL